MSINTLQQRAEEYAERIAKEQKDAYIFTDAEVLVEDAYKAGAEDEHRLLTEWLNPAEELPKEGEEVLCIIHRHFQTYAVLRYLNNQWWQPLAPQPNVSLGGWIAAEKEPIAWRPIHEYKDKI